MNEKTITSSLDVSVIIPTYNRFVALLETLDALSAQTLDKNRFEVIVVDDGSTDATPEVVTRPYAFTLHYVAQANQGSAAARNHGARVSTGRVLVFIDDDISLAPAYLQAVLEACLEGQKTVCMGVFQPYLPQNSSIFATLHPHIFPAAYPDLASDEEVAFVECTSNNVAIERHFFAEIGRWQDVLGDGPTLWGDVEFGYRALQQGCRFVRVANAQLIHRDQHIADLAAATKRAYHISAIVQPLFVLHPSIKEHLPMFHDKCPIVWRQDSPALVWRKLVRSALSSGLVMRGMQASVSWLERWAVDSALLPRIYRWIISGHIYRGYRAGLQQHVQAVGGGFGEASQSQEKVS